MIFDNFYNVDSCTSSKIKAPLFHWKFFFSCQCPWVPLLGNINFCDISKYTDNKNNNNYITEYPLKYVFVIIEK